MNGNERRPVFTKEQSLVIQSPQRKICVCAEAGSGKTSVLTGRYRFLCSRMNVDPSRISCITFTRAAADNMRRRLEEKEKAARAKGEPFPDVSRSRISTFHNLGMSLIGRIKGYEGVRPRPVGERQLVGMVPLDSYSPLSAEKLVRFIQEAKEQMLTPESDLRPFCRSKGELDERAPLFQKAFRAYEAKMAELHGKGLFDIADLVYIPVMEMKSNPAYRAEVSKLYDAFLVDEYQDVNRMQSQMLSLMTRPETYVLVVGDDDQSIYAWRGAVSGMLSDQAKEWDVPMMNLSRNFRCPKPIVQAAECFVKDCFGRIDKTMESQKEGEKPVLKVSSDERAELDSIVEAVEGWADERASQGLERYGNEIAVLARTTDMARKVRERLAQKGIPTASVKTGSDTVQKTASILLWALGRGDVEVLFSTATDAGCIDLTRRLHDARANEGADDARTFLEKANAGRYEPSLLASRLLAMHPTDDLASMIDAFSEIGYFTSDESKVLSSIKERTKGKSLDDAYDFIADWIPTQRDVGGDKAKADVVTVSTIHGVKGLEFEDVIVDMTYGVFGRPRSPITDEELRLAYVASTRAGRNLLYTVDGRRGPSPILTDYMVPELVVGMEGLSTRREGTDFRGYEPISDAKLEIPAVWCTKEPERTDVVKKAPEMTIQRTR